MLKVATYNVNSIRQRLHILIPWIKENKPDIVCLQETKVENRKFPEADFHRIGYNVVFYGKGGMNGVAIVSKEEPKNVKFGFYDEPRDEDRLMLAEVAGIKVVNTYVPQGFSIDSEKYVYKLKWLERLRKFFEKFNLKDYIAWCGDMNVAPEPIDVHSPDKLKDHVCFHEDARNAYKKILALGFLDLLRKHHPNEKIYTFYDYRVKGAIERGLGWRVDSINATEPLAEKSIDCYVDMKPRLLEKSSDHTILVAEFNI
ncbi:MAG: exodeoxyribonuclease III [Archaeoglobaceae archaeon]|nr:exodeoxyribonuclease III [Archaeoglobaceae archaeon]MCX8152490.1 exodeoxyribonuclease III [Archaeoglobaceae archaeon]MDW8013695.1 exodeoxyribonuclease III [Archaeoglobaceae archaeon]